MNNKATINQRCKRKMKRAAVKISLPRRARRGFSLAEMALVLIISAFLIQTGIEVATSHTKRQITQRTASTISRVADDVQTYMDRNYFALAAELTAAPNNIIERPWNDLISTNLISQDAAPISPDGGEVRLFFTLRSDTVYAVLMSFDGNESTFAPRPDANTKFAGKIQGNSPNNLNGWDFSLAVPEIATLTGEDLTGNIGVIRYVAFDVNVDPYLHRIAVPGRPELNEMEADLSLGGFNITNALDIETTDFRVQDELSVNGRLTANDITSTGDATIGDVTANSVASDEVRANNANFTGDMTVASAVVNDIATQTVTGQNASFVNLSATNFNGGSVFLTTGNYIQIDVNRIDAEEIIADQVFIGD
jgi:type II secretory pathway pseudopilin PulG